MSLMKQILTSRLKRNRKDVQNKLHKIISPSELQKTRTEYKPFQKQKFKEHIYQEVWHQKFIFYLQQKQKAKE